MKSLLLSGTLSVMSFFKFTAAKTYTVPAIFISVSTRISPKTLDSFDALVEQMNEINIVKLNKDVWENSECSCREWLKFLK